MISLSSNDIPVCTSINVNLFDDVTLCLDFGFIAVLLGILNLDKFIDAKYGGSKPPEDPTS